MVKVLLQTGGRQRTWGGGVESVLGRLLGKSCSVTFLLNHSFLFCLKIVEYIFFDKGLYGRQSKCQPQLTVSLEEGDRVS